MGGASGQGTFLFLLLHYLMEQYSYQVTPGKNEGPSLDWIKKIHTSSYINMPTVKPLSLYMLPWFCGCMLLDRSIIKGYLIYAWAFDFEAGVRAPITLVYCNALDSFISLLCYDIVYCYHVYKCIHKYIGFRALQIKIIVVFACACTTLA